MLKGQVFSRQLFESQIFALFINTFLNGENGVSSNYKNAMQPTYSGSNVTINSGAVCIQGRFLEEDTGYTVNAGTNPAYCKLVIEINLDEQNTESEFNQGSYKIITGSSTYPTLTQSDIVKNNSGIYQYELARFRTTASGITDFQDMRTFLDFDSIYTHIKNNYETLLKELEDELANVEDGSAYVLKKDYQINKRQFGYVEKGTDSNLVKIYLTYTRTGNIGQIKARAIFSDKSYAGLIELVNIPDFMKTAVLAANDESSILALSDIIGSGNTNDHGVSSGSFYKRNDRYILRLVYAIPESESYDVYEQTFIFNYIIEEDLIDESKLLKGDCNLDGVVNEDDLMVIQGYIMGYIDLSPTQFKNCDMDDNGEVTSADYMMLQNQLEGN